MPTSLSSRDRDANVGESGGNKTPSSPIRAVAKIKEGSQHCTVHLKTHVEWSKLFAIATISSRSVVPSHNAAQETELIQRHLCGILESCLNRDGY